jgi:hypothetical protein
MDHIFTINKKLNKAVDVNKQFSFNKYNINT